MPKETITDEVITHEQLLQALQDVYDSMLRNTKEEDPELTRILNENFWELIEED